MPAAMISTSYLSSVWIRARPWTSSDSMCCWMNLYHVTDAFDILYDFFHFIYFISLYCRLRPMLWTRKSTSSTQSPLFRSNVIHTGKSWQCQAFMDHHRAHRNDLIGCWCRSLGYPVLPTLVGQTTSSVFNCISTTNSYLERYANLNAPSFLKIENNY